MRTSSRTKRSRFAHPSGLLLIAVIALVSSTHAAKLLYRYTDDRGVVSIEDQVPPEFVRNGYTVLTPDGRVVEEVPPQLSGEARLRQQEAEFEAKRLREWDESLLRRFSTVEDIESARDRAVQDYTVRINILRSNLVALKSQIERELATAADLERSGREVPQSLADTLDALRAEVRETEQAVAQREAEVAEVKASYQRDINRFVELKDVVEWRRRRQGAGGE